MRLVRTITPQHVVGLVVGEGCFYAESRPDPKYRLGWRIRPAFCIEMREDDRDALELVQRHLGCGKVYDLEFGRYRSYESRGWRPHVKYRVSNIKDLGTHVVPFFRAHPLFGRKASAFEIFAELVELIAARHHLAPAGLDKARSVARRLAAHNERGGWGRGAHEPGRTVTLSEP